MLLECKTNEENFPLNEEEIHQTFTNLGFVLNWAKRFSKALELCEKDTDRFIDVLQQFLTQPKFGTVCLGVFLLSFLILRSPNLVSFAQNTRKITARSSVCSKKMKTTVSSWRNSWRHNLKRIRRTRSSPAWYGPWKVALLLRFLHLTSSSC
jgi:hypothetical protein